MKTQLPNPIDVQQATEEEIVSYVLQTQGASANIQAELPGLTRRMFDTKRNLEQAKAIIKHVPEKRDETGKLLPKLIAEASNARRDLEIAKDALKHLGRQLSGCQSVLKAMRPV